MEEQGARKTNKLENLNKKLAEAVSKKDYALAATIQGELVKMEEHAAQKMNTLKVRGLYHFFVIIATAYILWQLIFYSGLYLRFYGSVYEGTDHKVT